MSVTNEIQIDLRAELKKNGVLDPSQTAVDDVSRFLSDINDRFSCKKENCAETKAKTIFAIITLRDLGFSTDDSIGFVAKTTDQDPVNVASAMYDEIEPILPKAVVERIVKCGHKKSDHTSFGSEASRKNPFLGSLGKLFMTSDYVCSGTRKRLFKVFNK